MRLHIVRATDGSDAKEEKDKEFAQAIVAKREGPAGIGQRGQDSRNADGQDRPAAHPDQVQADHDRQGNDHDNAQSQLLSAKSNHRP